MYEGYIGNGPERPQLRIADPVILIEPTIGLLNMFKGLEGTLIIDDIPREEFQQAIMAYTIELDCPPGKPRPDDLLPGILKDTPLTPEDFEITSKVFGNWTFVLKDDKNSDVYVFNQPTYKERIEKLYKEGKLRYASW